MQSTLLETIPSPFHVAIIMDGNGRWAQGQGLPRSEGHREGSLAVRRVVETAPSLGITTMTLYAFSSDNWRRPVGEVNQLMRLLHDFLIAEKENCITNGVRVSVIGRRDRLSPWLRAAIRAAEAATRSSQTLHLRIAIDYSARDSILRAAQHLEDRTRISFERFSYLLGEVIHSFGDAPDVDLLIRTGGEQRLSDFLLWESAYAELLFTNRMWPEFDGDDLRAAVHEFHNRERRFGRIESPKEIPYAAEC